MSVPKSKSGLPAVTESPTLKELLQELMEECAQARTLWQRLREEKSWEQKGKLESELYVTLVGWEAKLKSVLKEWDRVVDEELVDEPEDEG